MRDPGGGGGIFGVLCFFMSGDCSPSRFAPFLGFLPSPEFFLEFPLAVFASNADCLLSHTAGNGNVSGYLKVARLRKFQFFRPGRGETDRFDTDITNSLDAITAANSLNVIMAVDDVAVQSDVQELLRFPQDTLIDFSFELGD